MFMSVGNGFFYIVKRIAASVISLIIFRYGAYYADAHTVKAGIDNAFNAVCITGIRIDIDLPLCGFLANFFDGRYDTVGGK